ncbi:Gamma-glutamyl phosphate reductase [Bienertia sinuspersici]
MDLISDLSVRELDLYLTVRKERFYVLPLKVLAMESLQILNLRGCLLSSSFNRNAIKLTSLIQLHLRDVSIDEETIQDLIFSIRSMEFFSLKNCLGFENLEICDHDKLKKIVYHPHKDLKVKKFSINLPTLEELDFCSVDKEKRLSLCGIPIDTKWLQSMLSSFPLLEHLFLGGCVLQQVMKLSSSVLKETYLCNCRKLVEAEFDTPNVKKIPFSAKDFMGIQISLFKLNNMTLVTHALTLGNYAGLLDGLFCSVHPQILSLELNYYSPEFLKRLLKSLVVDKPKCCCSEEFQCWRHTLKVVKLINNVKGFQSTNSVLNAMTLKNLTEFLDEWAVEAHKTVQSFRI